MTYADAVAKGLSDAMRENDKVWVLGEDVSHGGAYGATQGLKDLFGGDRVRDTPISEAAIIGFSVGSAMTGWRPVAELMHMDFSACAMDQLVNQLAKMRYMMGGSTSLPATVRCGVGGWLNAAAQHSQSLEAWFTHIPGLKVAAAATPADVRAVLLAAIRDDDPVIVLESLSLYPEKGEVSDDPVAAPLGIADVKRPGDDLTILTWGGTVPRVLRAAETAAAHAVSAEVIDLLWLHPLDREAIVRSIEKTHRVLIVHQACERAGFGAEIAAFIAAEAFDLLDAPIRRVAGLNVPVPFAPALENYVLPGEERIARAIFEVAA
jgi:pyruvate dehydrogenase E1 component beta subunit